MKATYFFTGAVALLAIVGCSNMNENRDNDLLDQAAISVAGTNNLTIDSFRRSTIVTIPGNLSAETTTPKSSFSVQRDRDSVTYSGTLYIAGGGQNTNNRQAYHFYLKAGPDYSYAYLKYTSAQQIKMGEKQLQGFEAGYVLRVVKGA